MDITALYEKGKIIKNYERVSEVLKKSFTNLTKLPKLKKGTSRKRFLNKSIKKTNQSYPSKELSLSMEFVKLKPEKSLKVYLKVKLLCLKISK